MSARHILLAATAVAPFLLAGAAHADDPLMGRMPWNFSYQNRAAVAIAIKNIEDPASGGSGAGTIVCGGTSGASGQGATGSGASAAANSSCIIINNSPGSLVQNDQISDGDQTADSEATSNVRTTNTTEGNGRRHRGHGRPGGHTSPSGSIDEVAAVLGGHRQGL
jgi:hypothetical protein